MSIEGRKKGRWTRGGGPTLGWPLVGQVAISELVQRTQLSRNTIRAALRSDPRPLHPPRALAAMSDLLTRDQRHVRHPRLRAIPVRALRWWQRGSDYGWPMAASYLPRINGQN